VSNATNVSHASIRILISFAAIKDYHVWTKDATQAFLQSKEKFSRDLYARLPLELRSVFKGNVLMILKPFYGTKKTATYGNAAYSGDWKQKDAHKFATSSEYTIEHKQHESKIRARVM
jgi:hypothetical protein